MRSSSLVLFLWLTLSASAVNLVPNSSFECGAGRGWQMVTSAANLKDEIVAGGFHGDSAARLTQDHVLISPPIWMANGVQYVFSWYENANEANTAFWQIGQLGTQFGSGTSFIAPTSWTRRSVTFTPTTNDYHQIALWHFQSTMTLKVDAFQVEAGAVATTYAPQSTVEAALATTVTNNTFFTEDTKQVAIKWWNDGAATTNSIAYEIFDLWNRKQSVGILTATLASGATTSTLSLPTLNGWHRVTTRITTVNKSWDELTCAVLPVAATFAPNTNGIIGAHSEGEAGQVNYLRSAGFTWTRGLSPNFRWIRWQNVEATQDAFTFRDDLLYPFATNGLTVLGTLTALDGAFPSWAVQGDGGILKTDWTNYVGTIVNRYKSVVHHWEIYNEAQQSGPAWIQNYSNYANVLTWSCEQIKAVDSTAKIIAIGGAYDNLWASNVWRLLTPTTKGQIDFVSCHLYPNDNSADQNDPEYDSRHKLWKDTFAGINIWNSESGTYGFGGMLGESAIWGYYYQPGIAGWLQAEAMIRSPRSVDKITRCMFRSFGNGFARFFNYDNRRWTQQAVTSTQPYSFEYTGSPRPTATALAIAASFVDGFSSVSQITNASAAELEMYVFDMGSTRVAVVFNYNRVSADVATAETAFTVYDVMGNAATQPSGKIRITKTPQYIVTSLTVGQITTVLQGSPTSVADTIAPQISVDIAPSGSWAGGEAFLKWSGVDQTYVNSAAHTQYVEFANHFNTDAYGAWSQTNMLRTVLSAGNHVLWVKARDIDGNTQETNYIFSPGAATNTPTLNVSGALTVGTLNLDQ